MPQDREQHLANLRLLFPGFDETLERAMLLHNVFRKVYLMDKPEEKALDIADLGPPYRPVNIPSDLIEEMEAQGIIKKVENHSGLTAISPRPREMAVQPRFRHLPAALMIRNIPPIDIKAISAAFSKVKEAGDESSSDQGS